MIEAFYLVGVVLFAPSHGRYVTSQS